MHRKGYKKRWVGHRGQEISNNALKDCEKFLYDIIKLRKQYKFNIKDIINCDEIAVCLNNPSNMTLTKKGSITFNCKTLKREKMLIIVILTITGDGKFLPPFIIFKGEKQSKLYKKIQKLYEMSNKKLFATTQKNAWVDDEVFKEYMKNVLFPYNPLDKKLLIFDKCTTHLKGIIQLMLENNNYIKIFVPAGMTMVLQPLDRSINFPFKCYLKDKFTSFMLDNKELSKEKIDDCLKRIVKDIIEIINNANNNKSLAESIRN